MNSWFEPILHRLDVHIYDALPKQTNPNILPNHPPKLRLIMVTRNFEALLTGFVVKKIMMIHCSRAEALRASHELGRRTAASSIARGQHSKSAVRLLIYTHIVRQDCQEIES